MSRHDVHILPAVFTPMHDDGSLNLKRIDSLFQRCDESGFPGIFLNGTTGECMSLDKEERKKILEAWNANRKANDRKDFRIVVHVGSANLSEAAELAEHAQACGADGISMVPTFYFRPKSLDELIDQCKYVADAASGLPFYYYNIPSMTHVNFPLTTFIKAARKEIRTFAGLKNSFNDLVDYQQCLHETRGEYEMYWGTDEVFTMLYAAGNRHYVGSTYNYMGEIYFEMLDALHDNNLEKLTALQADAAEIYKVMNDFNSLIAGKEIMKFIGIDCGPVRRPLRNLQTTERNTLKERLQKTRLFDLAVRQKQVNI